MDIDADIDDLSVPQTTGKFGTGFITTHLLSRVVNLDSVFDMGDQHDQEFRYRKFSLRLDRRVKGLEEFIDEYKREFGVFEQIDGDDTNIIENYQPG